MQPSERESPRAVFATAQAAIARGDWETFFACLDTIELVRIAKNGLGFVLAGPADPAVPRSAPRTGSRLTTRASADGASWSRRTPSPAT